METEVVGKKLLQNGQLARRVTIIPLNKINGRSIDDRTANYAANLVCNKYFTCIFYSNCNIDYSLKRDLTFFLILFIRSDQRIVKRHYHLYVTILNYKKRWNGFSELHSFAPIKNLLNA